MDADASGPKPMTPEQLDRYLWSLSGQDKTRVKRINRARRACESCAACGEPIASVDTVRIDRVWTGGDEHYLAPVCRQCWARRSGDSVDWLFESPKPCDGCGRPVAYYRPWRSKRRGPRKVVACSQRCAAAAYQRRRAEAARRRWQWGRRKTCAACGVRFDATRRDTRTCSPACRQKAYRARLDKVPPSRKRPNGYALVL